MYERLTGCSGKCVAEAVPESTLPGGLGTHIDFVFLVADEEVVHYACFMEVPKADHVFHPLDRGGVHKAHHVHVPSRDPVFLNKARHVL